jgi:hypothetical protein
VLSQMGWLDETKTAGVSGSSSSCASSSSTSPGHAHAKSSMLSLVGAESDLFSNALSSGTFDSDRHPEDDEGDLDDCDDGDDGGLTMEELREAKAKLQNMTVGTIGSSREELRAKLRRRFESLCK